MILNLRRKWFSAESTIGELYVDGIFECYTLEDCVHTGLKIAGKTAIPAGGYEVVIDHSARFNRQMPHILDVPGFEGIRIHCGNCAEDTAGCVLLGKTEGKNWIGQSRIAFDDFFPKLQQALSHESARIVITNEPAPETVVV